MTRPVWHLQARVRGAGAAEAVAAILDRQAAAVSVFEVAPGADWQLDAYPAGSLRAPDFAVRLALAAAAAGGRLVELTEERLAERDWVAENQLAFPPLEVGRFFIYGSHHRQGVPAARIGIRVDAATAFGTGEHPTTRGCLLALQFLAEKRKFSRPLDIGTGTGILAIAAAKLLGCRVRAGDVDPGAVSVARRNIAENGLAGRVRVALMPGYRGLGRQTYDLVLSNILARPLARMAPDLGRHLGPGGRAVLSGLLKRQEPIVLAAHRACGLVLERRVVIEGWSTLVLRR